MDQALRDASQALGALADLHEADPHKADRHEADLDESAQFDGAFVFTTPLPGSPNLYRLVPTSELGRRFVGIDSKQARDWSQRPIVNYIPGRQIADGHLMYVPFRMCLC